MPESAAESAESAAGASGAVRPSERLPEVSVQWLAEDPDAEQRWDAFVRASWNGTFMHTRRFIGYHGDRFRDRSLVARDSDGELVGVLPAAEDPTDAKRVVSHPGLSYGGWVHAGELRGEKMRLALRDAGRRLRELGYERLRYKAVPFFYHRVPTFDDAFALPGIGAVRYRCDITSVIDLANRPRQSARRRRGLRRAQRSGVVLAAGDARVADLWSVLRDNLRRRHQTDPVHTCEELTDLLRRFPAEIEVRCALLSTRIVAGVVLFHAGQTTHAQYIASSPEGFALSALDLVLEESIGAAAARGARYFDFGISTEDQGRKLNDGLYRFKNEFGAGSALCEFYDVGL